MRGFSRFLFGEMERIVCVYATVPGVRLCSQVWRPVSSSGREGERWRGFRGTIKVRGDEKEATQTSQQPLTCHGKQDEKDEDVKLLCSYRANYLWMIFCAVHAPKKEHNPKKPSPRDWLYRNKSTSVPAYVDFVHGSH